MKEASVHEQGQANRRHIDVWRAREPADVSQNLDARPDQWAGDGIDELKKLVFRRCTHTANAGHYFTSLLRRENVHWNNCAEGKPAGKMTCTRLCICVHCRKRSGSANFNWHLKGRAVAGDSLTTIDLFCGAGGLSEGFRQAGFDVVAANDFDESARQTYELNHPETAFLPGSIEGIRAEHFLEAAGLQKGELCVLAGGPPCQAFSVYNHQRGMHDDRSGLFREYLRIVEGLMPQFVVMENVTGMTSVEGGRAVEEITNRLSGLGFEVEHRILKAEEYGVPQERRRLVFLASRDCQRIVWPEPTNQLKGKGSLFDGVDLPPPVTVHEAISDLPELQIGEGSDVGEYASKPVSQFQRMLRRGSRRLFNHVAPFLAEINLRRLKHIPPGGSWRDIPPGLLPAGMKRAKRSDHTKRYGRLHPQGLSSTILTKCDLHWGAFIHPSQERTLTVREAARLQSFPDKLRFLGCRSEQFRQVGNAVPPLLGKSLAEAVREMLGVPGRLHASSIG